MCFNSLTFNNIIFLAISCLSLWSIFFSHTYARISSYTFFQTYSVFHLRNARRYNNLKRVIARNVDSKNTSSSLLKPSDVTHLNEMDYSRTLWPTRWLNAVREFAQRTPTIVFIRFCSAVVVFDWFEVVAWACDKPSASNSFYNSSFCLRFLQKEKQQQ